MNSTALSFLKSENNHAHAYAYAYAYAYDHHQSLYLEDQPLLTPGTSAWEQHQTLFADSFGAPFCTSDLQQLPWHNTHVPCLEFKDLEDICGEFGLWATDINKSFFEEDTNIVVVDTKPLINAARESTLDQSEEKVDRSSVIGNKVVSWRSQLQSERSIKSSGLQLNEIRKYFDVPITKAAKELNVGLTVLKKRCRELSIMRWPHRKIKSLKSLINNAKELGLTDEIEMLEEHRRMMQKLPEMELTERTKKLRQACFKANYKKRRALA